MPAKQHFPEKKRDSRHPSKALELSLRPIERCIRPRGKRNPILGLTAECEADCRDEIIIGIILERPYFATYCAIGHPGAPLTANIRRALWHTGLRF